MGRLTGRPSGGAATQGEPGGTRAHQSVPHPQWRVEKNCDSLDENQGNSETEMSPAGWPAVCGRGGSHWRPCKSGYVALGWPSPEEVADPVRLARRVLGLQPLLDGGGRMERRSPAHVTTWSFLKESLLSFLKESLLSSSAPRRGARFCSSGACLDLIAAARHRQGWVKAGGAAEGKP